MHLEKRKQKKTQELPLIAMLASIIVVTGTFKIPSPLIGTEFQLSAPIAVIIAALFGFKRYFYAGLIASGVSLLIGTHTIINVFVAIIFRIVAGGTIGLFGTGIIILIIAGPLGTLVARFVLAALLDINPKILIVSALPGMIFTAIVTFLIYPIARKIIQRTPFKHFLVHAKQGVGFNESILHKNASKSK